TVEAKTIDQQVRHLSSGGPGRHPAVELFVDDFNFVPRQRTGVLVGGAERPIIQEEFSPNVGTDQRELIPRQIEFSRQELLQRRHLAFAGGRRALTVHKDWLSLPRQCPTALTRNRFLNKRNDGFADDFAAIVVTD